MAKNPASFQKRQRELDKKRKADDKRKRRESRKTETDNPDTSTASKEDQETIEESAGGR